MEVKRPYYLLWMLNLKNRHWRLFYQQKMHLFGNKRELQSLTNKLRQNCRQVQEIKERQAYYLFIWERERERERTRVHELGEAEGEGERESQADSTLSAEPDVGLDLMTLRSWPELKSRVGRSTDWATQVLWERYFWVARDTYSQMWFPFSKCSRKGR